MEVTRRFKEVINAGPGLDVNRANESGKTILRDRVLATKQTSTNGSSRAPAVKPHFSKYRQAASPTIPDLRFLVVEDQELQRTILVTLLASLGARNTVEAADGQSALDIIQAQDQPIDIVITDLAMPGMDGMGGV